MRILVTGGRGAIGRRLMQKLAALGYTPISYDIVDGQDLFNLLQLEEAITSVDVVYHVAAEANPSTMHTLEGGHNGIVRNVGATDNVAYACAKHGKWMLFISSILVYGTGLTLSESEEDAGPNPSEIYAASKYAAEWVVRGYGTTFHLPYTILRIATVYGPGCRPEVGVHVFLNQALAGKPITVYGDGSTMRTLTYIDDVVDGIVSPLAHVQESKGQIFNITAAEQISALDMALQIKTLTGSSSAITFMPEPPFKTQHKTVDASKAKRLLQWEANTTFSEGLQKTLIWIRQQM